MVTSVAILCVLAVLLLSPYLLVAAGVAVLAGGLQLLPLQFLLPKPVVEVGPCLLAWA